MDSTDSLLAELLTTKQAADLLNVHPVTLAQYRVDNVGPTYVKIGRRVFYRRKDLEAFIETVEPEARR